MSPGEVVRLPVVLGVAWRTIPPSVAGIAACAMAPAIIVAARGGNDFAGAMTAASLIAGSGAGYAADDPAAPTLASSPTTLATRRALRGVLIALVLVTAWAVAVVLARFGSSSPDVGLFAAELSAAGAVSASVAFRAPTDAPISVGAAATAAALITMVVIAALASRWPTLPALGVGGRHHGRWWWVAVAATASATGSSRDPASRLSVDLGALRLERRA